MISARTISKFKDGAIVYYARQRARHNFKRVTYRYGLNSSHSKQIIRMLPHSHDLWDYRNLRPFNTENFCKFFQVDSGSLPYAVNRISKPRHAQSAQLFVEERLSQLVGEQRYILYDGLPHTPRLVLGKLYDSWEEALRQ